MELILKRRAILSALAGAKAAYPNEFICILTGSVDKPTSTIVIEDTLIPPGIMVSRTMSSFSEWMLPTIEGMVGIFHSHPGALAHPSSQDLRLFSKKGGVNIIAGEPFEISDIMAFVSGGKRIPFKVID